MIEEELRSARARCLYIYNYITIMSPFKKFAVVSDGHGKFGIKNVQTGKLGDLRWDSPREAGMFLANEVAKRTTKAEAEAPQTGWRYNPPKRPTAEVLEDVMKVLDTCDTHSPEEWEAIRALHDKAQLLHEAITFEVAPKDRGVVIPPEKERVINAIVTTL